MYYQLESPIGALLAAEENGKLTMLHLRMPTEPEPPEMTVPTPLGRQLQKELCAYFEGSLQTFTVPVYAVGTPFQMRIWRALTAIPYGETRSYGELAAMAGCPSAARAAGGACHRNPVLLLIPCHRVIGRSGALTGFACGTDIKAKLLALEARAHPTR